MSLADLTIESIDTDLVVIPMARPNQVGLHLPARSRNVTLICHFRTSSGLTGHSYVHADSVRQMAAIQTLVPDLEEAIKGCNALERHKLVAKTQIKLRELMQYEGASRMILSLVDIAAWDLFGKSTGLPVHRLLGGSGDPVPVYGSHGLTAGQSTDELAPTARSILSEGFAGVKVRVGGGRPLKEDVERVLKVREAIGDEGRIMLDALWSLTPMEAIRLADGVAEAGITWLEDPLPEGNFSELRFVREHVKVPIASGERISNVREFARLLDEQAIDIAIVDTHHIGGVTGWMTCAQMARQRDVPIAGHGSAQLNCHLLSAAPNGFLAEYMAHAGALYRNAPLPGDGVIVPPDSPGWGLELDEEVVERYRVDDYVMPRQQKN